MEIQRSIIIHFSCRYLLNKEVIERRIGKMVFCCPRLGYLHSDPTSNFYLFVKIANFLN